MKITKVNIPVVSPEYEIEDNGLKPILMDKMGHVVILAGKNGSGKSRILTKISLLFQEKPTKREIDNVNVDIADIKRDIKSYNNLIEINMRSLMQGKTDVETQQIQKTIEQSERYISNSQKSILELQSKKMWNFIETNEVKNEYEIIHFVPKSLDLRDCNSLTPDQLKVNSKNVSTIGVTNLPECSLAKIKKVVDDHFTATHQNYAGAAGAQRAIWEYEVLDDLIYTFLGARLARNMEGDTTLFGFPIGSAKLSDGQKVLLQLCVAIHAQGVSLDDMILFLDEPENHMHPSVTLEFLDALIQKVPHGQIWIATHSIPLISHFGSENIWYVDEGKVSYAGKEQEKVLESLLGNEEEIERLNDLINLPAASAINNFACECLSPPGVVMTGTDDPQSKQISFILMEQLKKGTTVKLLDYGAGKGRFISNFFDRLEEDEKQLIRTRLEYVAFDKYDYDRSDCLKNIERVYGDAGKKYYNDMTGLLSDHDKGSFDLVVLCNVLHEIDPKEWLDLFKAEGDITPLLKDGTGLLLHVEDMLLPVGEKAYKNGFVVLDTPHLKELFELRSDDFEYFTSEVPQFKNRLKAHLIPKRNLSSITHITRKNALTAIQKTAKDEIKTIRVDTPNYRNGKKHAFWVQQFANSSLALGELSEEG